MELFDCSDCSDCSIGGWHPVDEPEVGRVGRAFVVCKDEDPTRRFVLKLWRDDQPGLGWSGGTVPIEFICSAIW